MTLPMDQYTSFSLDVANIRVAQADVQTADALSLQVWRNQLTTYVTRQHFKFKLLIQPAGAFARSLAPVR
jgi:hypothetical protein